MMLSIFSCVSSLVKCLLNLLPVFLVGCLSYYGDARVPHVKR